MIINPHRTGSVTRLVTRRAECGRERVSKESLTPRFSHAGSARAPRGGGDTGARRSRHVPNLRTVARCGPSSAVSLRSDVMVLDIVPRTNAHLWRYAQRIHTLPLVCSQKI